MDISKTIVKLGTFRQGTMGPERVISPGRVWDEATAGSFLRKMSAQAGFKIGQEIIFKPLAIKGKKIDQEFTEAIMDVIQGCEAYILDGTPWLEQSSGKGVWAWRIWL